jgi:hypothetical protein
MSSPIRRSRRIQRSVTAVIKQSAKRSTRSIARSAAALPHPRSNPAGKRPGTRNRATRALEELLDGEAGALTRKAIELALAGDMTALRLSSSGLIHRPFHLFHAVSPCFMRQCFTRPETGPMQFGNDWPGIHPGGPRPRRRRSPRKGDQARGEDVLCLLANHVGSDWPA